ncbi:MAG: phage holin family protein [Longimicrobiales bacterium]|nr:phage holin family protein [Longimicrobiales bacterium]
MRNLALRILINALALTAAAHLVSGVRISDRFLDVLWIALVFGVVNAVLKPVLRLLSFPLLLLTLGLFTLVINAALLHLTAALAPGITVDGWGAAIVGSVVVSVVSVVAGFVVGDDTKRGRRRAREGR